MENGDLASQAAARTFDRSAATDAETIMRRVIDIIESAKSMPLSASVLISKDEVLELIEEAIQRLPEELRQARWLLKEREEFLNRTRRESDEILEAARAQAGKMVERTEIVRQAQAAGRRTIEESTEHALRIRHEAEDFCDQKLAAFEIILERTAKMVQSGREKLQATPTPLNQGEGNLPGASPYGSEIAGAGDPAEAEEGFFDQDA